MERKTQKYIFLLLAMVLLFFGVSVGVNYIQKLKSTAYSINSMRAVFILQFFIYCIAGMILGLEKFIDEWKRNGHWKVNWLKFLIIGIPSFLIGIFNIFVYIILRVPPIIGNILITYYLFVNFMQILFGYTIITSFYKFEVI